MKILVTILISIVSFNLFAAKPSDTFKLTNLKMTQILLTITEEDESSDAEISQIRYKEVKPSTIEVSISTYQPLSDKEKKEYQSEFDTDVNYIAQMIGSDRVKVKVNFSVVQK